MLLDQLAPIERAVFVLADVFEVPYAEIAATVGRSPAACRQIASRARRRLRPDRQPSQAAAADRELVNGLLRALASGDVDEVVARLAPQVVCISDGGPEAPGRSPPGRRFRPGGPLPAGPGPPLRPHLAIRPAVVGGSAGAVLSAGDTIEQVMAVTSTDGVITSIYFVGNPDKLTSVGHPVVIE